MNTEQRTAAIEAGAQALHERRRAQAYPAYMTLWSGLPPIAQQRTREDATAVINAALPYLVGEPVGYVLADPVRRTVWMEQGVSTVVDEARQLREPQGDFIRCALVPVDEDQP